MTYSHPFARFRPALLFAALALLVVGTERVITRLPLFGQHPQLPLAVVLDVLVGLPTLFYFLVVRRYQLPLSTLAAAVGTCLGLMHWLLPVAQQQPLQVLYWLPAVLEAVTLAVLMARARRLVRAYRAAGAVEMRVLARVRMAVTQEMGKAGYFLLAEIDMLRFALLGWFARPDTRADTNATAFSSHCESGFVALVVVGSFGLLIETATVHLLARHWSHSVANWLLLIDLYGLALLVAHGHAVRLQPTLLTADAVIVRVGFFWQVAVPRVALVAIEPLRGDFTPGLEILNLARPLLAAPNLLLTFAEPVNLTGPYGIRRPARCVALYLDQPRQFIAAAGLPLNFPTR